MKIELIGFDADDTLWHTESLYQEVEERLGELLCAYGDFPGLGVRLYQREAQNIPLYGYGIKSYCLSMIETAIELTGGKIQAAEILKIIGFARQMMQADIELIEDARQTVETLSKTHHLMIITKGDLLDQEAKLDRSGLAQYFKHVEIVSEKTEESYADLLESHHVRPQRFLMVGNSLKSDVLPVVAIGGQAVYIPYALTWAHETVVEAEAGGKKYHQLEHIGQLPELVKKLTL
jgi:putative hydrolase of the HAD superfamily